MMIKPEVVAKGKTGAVLKHLEDKGLKIEEMQMMTIEKSLCKFFYKEHEDKPFYTSLVNYISSGPVVILAVSGEQAVAKGREIIGHTNPKEAASGTIRSLYGESIEKNAIHASDSTPSAKRELKLFFDEKIQVSKNESTKTS